MDEVRQLAQIVENSRNIVFFGGAGVSTESGIPDFRSTDGLYNQQWDYPPETILSHTFFERHTEDFYRFYREKMLFLDAKPNPAHIRLAQLEEEGKLCGVVTQNIDGLHQAAGSKKVFELHGSVLRNNCTKCGKFFPVQHILETEGVPRCDCGGVVRPDIVFYEEPLKDEDIERAVHFIREADVLIIGGTSLVVYPAAGLINYYRGHKLVLVNKGETGADSYADLVIHEKIGEVFSQL